MVELRYHGMRLLSTGAGVCEALGAFDDDDDEDEDEEDGVDFASTSSIFRFRLWVRVAIALPPPDSGSDLTDTVAAFAVAVAPPAFDTASASCLAFKLAAVAAPCATAGEAPDVTVDTDKFPVLPPAPLLGARLFPCAGVVVTAVPVPGTTGITLPAPCPTPTPAKPLFKNASAAFAFAFAIGCVCVGIGMSVHVPFNGAPVAGFFAPAALAPLVVPGVEGSVADASRSIVIGMIA
jgi:hypothetical protein